METKNDDGGMIGRGCIGVLLTALAGGGLLIRGLARFGDDAVRVAAKPAAHAAGAFDDGARGVGRAVSNSGAGGGFDDAGRALSHSDDFGHAASDATRFGSTPHLLPTSVSDELLKCRARTVELRGRIRHLHIRAPLHATRIAERLNANEKKRVEAEKQGGPQLANRLREIQLEQAEIEQEIAALE